MSNMWNEERRLVCIDIEYALWPKHTIQERIAAKVKDILLASALEILKVQRRRTHVLNSKLREGLSGPSWLLESVLAVHNYYRYWKKQLGQSFFLLSSSLLFTATIKRQARVALMLNLENNSLEIIADLPGEVQSRCAFERSCKRIEVVLEVYKRQKQIKASKKLFFVKEKYTKYFYTNVKFIMFFFLS